jgi:hypothetical protein
MDEQAREDDLRSELVRLVARLIIEKGMRARLGTHWDGSTTSAVPLWGPAIAMDTAASPDAYVPSLEEVRSRILFGSKRLLCGISPNAPLYPGMER